MFEPAAFGLMADDPQVRPFIDSIQAVLTTDPSPDEVLRRSVASVGDDLSRFSIPLPKSLVGAARVQMRSVFCWKIYLANCRAFRSTVGLRASVNRRPVRPTCWCWNCQRAMPAWRHSTWRRERHRRSPPSRGASKAETGVREGRWRRRRCPRFELAPALSGMAPRDVKVAEARAAARGRRRKSAVFAAARAQALAHRPGSAQRRRQAHSDTALGAPRRGRERARGGGRGRQEGDGRKGGIRERERSRLAMNLWLRGAREHPR